MTFDSEGSEILAVLGCEEDSHFGYFDFGRRLRAASDSTFSRVHWFVFVGLSYPIS